MHCLIFINANARQIRFSGERVRRKDVGDLKIQNSAILLSLKSLALDLRLQNLTIIGRFPPFPLSLCDISSHQAGCLR